MSSKPNLTETLVELTEQIRPIFEMGVGIRRSLETDGWSPTMAEQFAAQITLELLRRCLSA